MSVLRGVLVDRLDAATLDDGLSLLTVDLEAIAANYGLLRSIVAPAICAAVVKADAYGLGIGPVSAILLGAGCWHFFVATAQEAEELRGTLGHGPMIAVLNGIAAGTASLCEAQALTPVLNSLDQIAIWSAAAQRSGARLPAALQFDSGMSRLGLSTGDIETLVHDSHQLDGLDLKFVMSHLACADEADHPANVEQQASFARMAAHFPALPASLSASSGIFINRHFHFDMVRPGAALYGVAPQRGMANPMRAVVRLQGRIVQIRMIAAGTAVGYGHTARMDKDSVLAVVAVGYADGVPRSASGRTCAFAHGQRLPVVGRISMDSLIIDIGALPVGALVAGDLVDLIGPDHDLDSAAREAGTIGYELLTNLGQRFRRVYVGG